MKKLLAVLLLLCLLPCQSVVAEETSNGTITEINLDNYAVEETIDEALEPFIPENLEKKIIGPDDRYSIADPTAYPYSASAYMEVTARCNCSWTGTGFMVAEDVLLTAGHCLYCTDHLSWAESIDFYFGYKNGKNYYHRYNSKWNAWINTDRINGNDKTSNDYGVVKFRYSPPGRTTGWFGMCTLSDSQLDNSLLQVVGYRNKSLKADHGFVESLHQNIIYHDADTVSGNSGCPIITYQKDGEYTVGIHTAQSTNYNLNMGFRYDTRFLNLVRDVRDNK